jgi:uncharacterized protein YjbJ (UPF0337 family)
LQTVPEGQAEAPGPKEGTVDTDRIEGKKKETEGKAQQKWADIKDGADDKWEDVKDKVEDVADRAEDRWDERDEKDDRAAPGS